jgi:hypothetical protein
VAWGHRAPQAHQPTGRTVHVRAVQEEVLQGLQVLRGLAGWRRSAGMAVMPACDVRLGDAVVQAHVHDPSSASPHLPGELAGRKAQHCRAGNGGGGGDLERAQGGPHGPLEAVRKGAASTSVRRVGIAARAATRHRFSPARYL